MKTTVKKHSKFPVKTPGALPHPAAANHPNGSSEPLRRGNGLADGWLQENLARFDRMFAAQGPNEVFGQYIFSELALAVQATEAQLIVAEAESANGKFRVAASHGISTDAISKADEQRFRHCITSAALSNVASKHDGREQRMILPIVQKGAVTGVMAFTARNPFTEDQRRLLDDAARRFPAVLQSMESDVRTQRLLRQSESLTRELQNQQVWLKHTNDELEEKARMLAVQKIEMETRNRDIEQARLALQEQAQQLALTSKYKSEFLANMSHELRTPLNSMLLLARQLMDNREKTLSPKQLEFSKVIHAAGQELLHLVNDILDLAKIEAGKISIEIGDYPTADLPEFLDRNFQLLAQSKNLALKVEVSPDLPRVMQTDARRLEQILKNLLSNALKFTKHGGVTLRAQPADSGWSVENSVLNAAPGVIAFSVTDTGIGIPHEKQKLIFEAFQQADGSTNREYGGTGLGLTISRELAALLGGEIRLQSEPGKGSTFVLYLPETTVAPVHPAHGLRENQRAPSIEKLTRDPHVTESLRGLVALVVDDDIRNIFALTSLLERFEMSVVSAEEGQAALDLLEGNGCIDVVLMDIMMPGMDGYAVIEKLRRMERFKTLPIIAVTAKAMKGDREKCLRAGASEYVTKPLDPELLLNALKKCLQ
ncbi:MAG: ATP-binding response regulator [Limisphaerales bacterium]